MAEEIREYYIPDFSDWIKEEMFKTEFTKLCRDLRREGVTMRKEDQDYQAVGMEHDLQELKRTLGKQGKRK